MNQLIAMPNTRSSSGDLSEANISGVRHMRAWFVLVGMLALHILDEALNDFLGFYNPLVENMRTRVAWFPMPTFTLVVWLSGLVALVVVLAMLGFVVRRGGIGIHIASLMLSVIMFLNGLGHLIGSIYFQRWLAGATSSLLLIFASILLAYRTLERKRTG